MFEEYNPRNWNIGWIELGEAAVVLTVAVGLAWLVYRIAFALVLKLASKSESPIDDMVLQRIRRPIKWSLIAVAITIAAQIDPTLAKVWEPLGQFLRPALLGWIAYSIIKAYTAAMELQMDAAADPVAMRSRRTRIAILSRTATVAIIVITVGLMLFTIPAVQTIGATMLASAGLAALAVGAAAQPALKSLIAGLQIAITEPLRLGDMVVIEGHTGRVEEIHMAFIILRTWDERAVIIPTAQVLESSFEDWSRKSEVLTGPVFLHLDPATPVAPIRAEVERFVGGHELWDGRTAAVLVTEAYPESIELRIAVSASTIGDVWNLRCAVREHILEWLRANMPEALIRHRLEVESANARVQK